MLDKAKGGLFFFLFGGPALPKAINNQKKALLGLWYFSKSS